jgi:hypothetical protein
MEEHNQGLKFCMFMILFIGYFFLFFGTILICLVSQNHYRAHLRRKHDLGASKRIINTLQKQKYSVELFGELREENECIICMSSYKENDIITCLKCND